MSWGHLQFSKEFRNFIWNKYNKHCAYCGCELEYKDMQIDHLHPVYLGGSDNTDNLMPSCRMCNHYKATLTLEKFRKQLSKMGNRLNNSYVYRMAIKYKVVEQKNMENIKFYFEQVEENKGGKINE